MESPEQTLQACRTRIDALDESIAELLIARIGIIREVAALKAQRWPMACHIRPGREGQMHRAIAQRFTDSDFPPLMALAIWRQLIGGSTHLESPLNVIYLQSYPEHQFLAREYFGVQIGARASLNLADAVALVAANQGNILVLPVTENHTWWRDAALLHNAGLFIFAALPVEENNLPTGCTAAHALAALTPEASGDDVSYFVKTDGSLITHQGFLTQLPDAVFLGAHPRPIRLNAGVMYA